MVGDCFERVCSVEFGSILKSVLGSVLGSIFERFDEVTGNLLLTWNGKRAFIFVTFLPVSARLFASFLASPRLFGPSGCAGGTAFYVSSRLFSFCSRLFSLLPASAGGPAGRLLTFLPVSSPFFVCAQSGAVGFVVVFVNV